MQQQVIFQSMSLNNFRNEKAKEKVIIATEKSRKSIYRVE